MTMMTTFRLHRTHQSQIHYHHSVPSTRETAGVKVEEEQVAVAEQVQVSAFHHQFHQHRRQQTLSGAVHPGQTREQQHR